MHVEGVLDEVDLRGLAWQEDELDDVEAVGDLSAEHEEPVSGTAADEPARRDGVRVPGAAPFVQQAQTSGDGEE